MRRVSVEKSPLYPPLDRSVDFTQQQSTCLGIRSIGDRRRSGAERSAKFPRTGFLQKSDGEGLAAAVAAAKAAPV